MSFNDHHLDLLLSRLFHDLIGPVSAARNGLELVNDFSDDDIGVEAMDLVGVSVDQAVARLTFFRMAFGGAGSAAGHGFAGAQPIVREYLASRKLEVEFTVPPSAPVAPTGMIKVMLALVAIVADSLPRGGRIAVSLDPVLCKSRATEMMLSWRSQHARRLRVREIRRTSARSWPMPPPPRPSVSA